MDDLKMPVVRKTNLIEIVAVNLLATGVASFVQGNNYKTIICHLVIVAVAMVSILLMIENIRFESLIDNANINNYEGIKKSIFFAAALYFICTFIPEISIPWLLFPFILYDTCRFELTLLVSLFYGMSIGLVGSIDMNTAMIGGILILCGNAINKAGRNNPAASFYVLLFSSFICGFMGRVVTVGLPSWQYVIIILAVAIAQSLISIYLLLNQKVLTKDKIREVKEESHEVIMDETVDYGSYIDDKFSLVKDIKHFSQAEYNHARNLSRISASLIEKIGGDVDLTRMAGFYYRLGILQGEPVIENSIKLAYDYCFPQKVINILEEHDGTNRIPQSKESAVIHMTDMCLKKAELLRAKKLSSNWNQDMVIYQTLNELSATGIYDESGISMNQFLMIRDTLVEEGLRV
ncbi:MAG: hypothetical protein K6E13_01660 [Lachnospiraceae bacterium]|nr:hypothetical protein [Lachnospiraceae bacterium]